MQRKSSSGQFDSSGQFTIASHKALDKISAFALADPKHWILKVIQAAVASDCEEVRVGIARKYIKVELRGGCSFSLNDIAGLLTAKVQPTTDAGSELSLGLKALLRTCDFAISDSVGRRLRWRNGELTTQFSELVKDRNPYNILLWVSRAVKSSLWSRVEHAQESQQYVDLLRSRALFARLKLICDGRELSPVTVPTTHFCPRHGKQAWESPVHLLAAYLDKDGQFQHRVFAKSKLGKDASRTREPFLTLASDRQSTEFQIHLTISYSPATDNAFTETQYVIVDDAPFRVHFGRLGIIGETRVLNESRCGGAVYCELGAMCGDLSGLKVSSTHQDWDLYTKAMTELDAGLGSLVLALQEHSPTLHRYKPTKKHTTESTIDGTLASMLLSPVLLVVGLKAIPLGLGLVAASAATGRILPHVNLSRYSEQVLENWSIAVESFRRSESWKERSNFQLCEV